MAKLEEMLVMHCMTSAVLEFNFICKFYQHIDLQKEAIKRFSNKKQLNIVPNDDVI